LISLHFRGGFQALVGGGESSDEPLVPPPVFINAVRGLKLNFGNVGEEEREFKEKIDTIITIAEKVSKIHLFDRMVMLPCASQLAQSCLPYCSKVTIVSQYR
jgi:hypothetical protein